MMVPALIIVVRLLPHGRRGCDDYNRVVVLLVIKVPYTFRVSRSRLLLFIGISSGDGVLRFAAAAYHLRDRER